MFEYLHFHKLLGEDSFLSTCFLCITAPFNWFFDWLKEALQIASDSDDTCVKSAICILPQAWLINQLRDYQSNWQTDDCLWLVYTRVPWCMGVYHQGSNHLSSVDVSLWVFHPQIERAAVSTNDNELSSQVRPMVVFQKVRRSFISITANVE